MTSSVGTAMEESSPLEAHHTTASTFADRWPQSVAEFEVLVDALQHELVRFAYCRLRNRQDAEDAVQDVLLRAYLDREKHRDALCVVPYLYRMVANRCTDILRKRPRSAPAMEDVPASPDALDSSQGRLQEIEALLSALPSRQAEVMRLRIFSGLSFQAIAEVAGSSVPTIKSRFRYAIRKLRDTVNQGGYS